MKKIAFLFFTFLTLLSYSQKKVFEFDYLLEYDRTINMADSHVKKGKSKVYYLTNSKDNSYIVTIYEKDSLNYRLYFQNYKGLISNVNFNKKELNRAEFINIDCDYIVRWNNKFKYQTKNYDFYKLKDTVINQKSYFKYKLKSNNKRREKRKKLATQYYIVDKETKFHLPQFHFSTPYNEWKTNTSKIPNGILFQKNLYGYNGRIYSKIELINYYKTTKKIVIDKKCDYTNPENDIKFSIRSR